MPFPISGAGYQLGDGNTAEIYLGVQGAPSTATATATLTPAQVTAGLMVANPSATAATYTLPTAALLDAFVGNARADTTFELKLINLGTGSGAITLSAGAGLTLVGLATVAITSQASLLFRKIADGSWTVYRVA